MQVSKKKINQDLQQEINNTFAQLIADINTCEKAKQFLEDFLSETEFVALSKRLTVAYSLDKGLSYEQIKKELQVSSATIASVQSAMQNGSKGYAIALQYVKAEDFANKWSEKIGKIFSKKTV